MLAESVVKITAIRKVRRNYLTLATLTVDNSAYVDQHIVGNLGFTAMKRCLFMLAAFLGLAALVALYQVSMPGGARDQARTSWFGSLLEPVPAHAAPLEPRTNRSSAPTLLFPSNEPATSAEPERYAPDSTQPSLLQPPLNPAERRSKRRGTIQPARHASEPNLFETPTSQPVSATQPISPEPLPVESTPNSAADAFPPQSHVPANPPAQNRWTLPPPTATNVPATNIITMPAGSSGIFPEPAEVSPQDAQPLQVPSSFTPTSPVMATPPMSPGAPAELSQDRMNASDAAPLRVTSGVSLEWIAPKSANLGQEAICQLVCRNSATTTAMDVCVTVQLPATVERGRCEPAAEDDGGRMIWRLGKMPAGAAHAIQVGLTPTSRGNLQPLASVTCTRGTTIDIEVLEPQLEFKIISPKEAFVGQPASYQFVVSNKGRGPAWNVAIEAQLPPSMQSSQGSTLRYGIGTLGPGETRKIQSPVSGMEPGVQEIQAIAILGTQPVARSRATVEIMRPTLQLELDGPKMRYMDRKASFTAKVRNPGPSPLDNVQVAGIVPPGFRFIDAGSGGTFDSATRQVTWFVGRLEANETSSVIVNLLASELGDHRLAFAARADAGAEGQTEMISRIEGVSSLVLDVTDADDPVEVGGETVYQMRITNRGSLPARRVQIAATLPIEMRALNSNGPTRGSVEGQKVLFQPIEVLGPGQTEQFEVRVQCLKPGQARFRAYFRSDENPNPVLEEEATRVYAD
jgi:uncharacterized repeat protein (TIGR01451 family)